MCLECYIDSSFREYEDRAVAIAQNRSRWEVLRRSVQEGVANSPLFDMEQYVRHLERVYHIMWEIHAAGLPPRHFKLVGEQAQQQQCLGSS